MWSQRALKLTSEHDMREQCRMYSLKWLRETVYQGEGVIFPSHTADNRKTEKKKKKIKS